MPDKSPRYSMSRKRTVTTEETTTVEVTLRDLILLVGLTPGSTTLSCPREDAFFTAQQNPDEVKFVFEQTRVTEEIDGGAPEVGPG